MSKRLDPEVRAARALARSKRPPRDILLAAYRDLGSAGAAHLGMSASTYYKYLRAEGVTVRNAPPVARLARFLGEGGPDECWQWGGSLRTNGYGYFWTGTRNIPAHRHVYELAVGPVPDGMMLDHICHTKAVAAGTCDGGATCPHRACVNPAHLEPVTNKVNTQRGNAGKARGAQLRAVTHCPRGHEYTEENTYRAKNGSGGISRSCRECKRINDRERRELRAAGLLVDSGRRGPTPSGRSAVVWVVAP